MIISFEKKILKHKKNKDMFLMFYLPRKMNKFIFSIRVVILY